MTDPRPPPPSLEPQPPRYLLHQFRGHRADLIRAYSNMGINAERWRPGGQLRRPARTALPVPAEGHRSTSPSTKSMLPREAITSAISLPFHHPGSRLQIPVTRRPECARDTAWPIRRSPRSSRPPARRFDGLVDLSGGHLESFVDDLEVVDEGFDLLSSCVPDPEARPSAHPRPGADGMPSSAWRTIRALCFISSIRTSYRAYTRPRYGPECRSRTSRNWNTAPTSGYPTASPPARSMGPVTPKSIRSSSGTSPTPLVRPSQMGLLVRRSSYSSTFLGNASTNFRTGCCQPRGGSSARPPTRK